MAGNVWEWTADFYSETYYQTAPANNPAGPTTGEGHTFRGGSWASTQELKVFLVSAVGRLWNKPELRSDVLGFRCVSAP
jgi:formylglycine-generating enzyme required for sulfatase activity